MADDDEVVGRGTSAGNEVAASGVIGGKELAKVVGDSMIRLLLLLLLTSG